jgi:hypothetical protein
LSLSCSQCQFRFPVLKTRPKSGQEVNCRNCGVAMVYRLNASVVGLIFFVAAVPAFVLGRMDREGNPIFLISIAAIFALAWLYPLLGSLDQDSTFD